jgi:flagellar motor protein MotB
MLRLRFAGAAIVLMGAGCVPLTDYRKLEERFKDQEKYVQKHKDEVTEFQKREQMLTMQRVQQQKDLEIALARLAKSEDIRKQLEANRNKFAVSEMPASSKGSTEAAMGGFKINGDTGGIVLEHDVMFETGKHALKESGKKVLGDLIHKLNSSEFSRYCIRIDGHTDDQPVVKSVKENHDNWELGFKRAKAVLDFMVSKGVSQERCFLASFNCFRPIAAVSMKMPSKKTTVKKGEKDKQKHEKHPTIHAGDSAGRAQNRRVEIVLFDRKG